MVFLPVLFPVLLAPSGVLTKSPGKHLQRPDGHECIVGSLNHDAGQARADRLDYGLPVHEEGADLADCVQDGAYLGNRPPTLPLYDSL